MVNAPHLPNIEAIIDMSRGKRSALADLRTGDGRAALLAALATAHVFVQGYRPARSRASASMPTRWRATPGLVQVSLSAYGDTRSWGGQARLRLAGADRHRLQPRRSRSRRARRTEGAADADPRHGHAAC
jgi:hypothetical protein